MPANNFRCGWPTLLSFFVLFAVSWTSRAEPEYDDNGHVMLKPVLGRDLGIHKRSTPNHKLQNQTSTLYHSGKGTTNILANVTMDTGNNDMIISTDHFAEEINTINCEPDLRKLTLTFDDDQAYEDSIDDWEWVNFNVSRTFIMLVTGCPNQRELLEPWVVNNATYDKAQFTVHFAAERKEWNELPNQYTIDFEPADHPADVASRLARRDSDSDWLAHMDQMLDQLKAQIDTLNEKSATDPVNVTSRLGKRNIFTKAWDKAKELKEEAEKKIKEAAEAVEKKAKEAADAVAKKAKEAADAAANAAKKALDEAQKALGGGGEVGFTIPMKVPFPKTILSKTTQNGLNFGVTCNDCGMKGGIDVKGHIKVQLSADDQIPEFWIDITPKGLRADVLLELDVDGTLDPKKPWEKELPFPDFPLPGFGIKGLAQLGPVLGLKAGVKLSDVQGNSVIKSGISVVVNDDAKTRLSLHKGTDGTSSQWNPHLETKDAQMDSTVQGTFETYLEWDLGIEASILKNNIPLLKNIGVELGTGLTMKAPSLTLKSEALFDYDGVCNSTDNYGVNLSLGLGMDVAARAYFGTRNKENEFWKKDIWSRPNLKELAKQCKHFQKGPNPPFKMPTKGTPPGAKETAGATETSSGEAPAETAPPEASGTAAPEEAASGTAPVEEPPAQTEAATGVAPVGPEASGTVPPVEAAPGTAPVEEPPAETAPGIAPVEPEATGTAPVEPEASGTVPPEEPAPIAEPPAETAAATGIAPVKPEASEIAPPESAPTEVAPVEPVVAPVEASTVVPIAKSTAIATAASTAKHTAKSTAVSTAGRVPAATVAPAPEAPEAPADPAPADPATEAPARLRFARAYFGS